MRNSDKTAQKRKCFFHGGCAVLYLHVSIPDGSSHALLHHKSLVEELCAYTERVLLPAAREELDGAVRSGQGYRFLPHRVQISVTRTRESGGFCYTLRFSLLSARDTPARERALISYWDKAEQIQLPRLRRQRAADACP